MPSTPFDTAHQDSLRMPIGKVLPGVEAHHRRGRRRVDVIRGQWKGSLLIKGLLSPADGKLAREAGADGVILSNHEGRQLDHAEARLDVLPEVAAEKGGMAVVVDSGIRHGTDVLKTMALGADFIFVGRPFLFAAALGGVAGVEHATRLLREEVDRDMALVGARTLSELTSELVRPAGRRTG